MIAPLGKGKREKGKGKREKGKGKREWNRVTG
jgi:hypothetical protein